MEKRRVPFIDEMRGFLIIYVVIYHTLYDLAVLFPVGISAWFFSPTINTLRDILTGALLAISGTSCLFSRSNIRRGLKTLACALLLTAVTYIFMPGQTILFGVLHFLGLSMLLYGLLEKLISRIPTAVGAAVCIAVMALTWNLCGGSVGLFNILPLARLPESLWNVIWLFPLGFPCPAILSADYFPMLPWFFVFMLGAFAGRPIKAGTAPQFFYESRSDFLALLGRHTLIIYLVHQPVIYAILWIIFRLI